MSNFVPARRVFMVFGATPTNVHPIGTAFGVAKTGLLLTASHVVEGKPKSGLRVCCTGYSERLVQRVDRIIPHPEADIAALMLEPDERFEHFEVGTPPEGYDDFPLGEDVLSYGYPPLEKPVQPRLMKGHIQCHFRHHQDGYDYSALELAFPSFPGQSGSPIFLDMNRNAVIGVVTCSTAYESREEGDTMPSAFGSWAVGATLTPLAGWVDSID